MNPRLSIALLSLFGLSRTSETNKTTAATPGQSTAQSPTATPSRPAELGYYKLAGDSVVMPAFTIDVDLSDKARKKLKADSETIIVAAYFSGTPTDTTSEAYRKEGDYFVATSKQELQNGHIATFDNVRFAKTRYDSLADKDIQVLINVYSGRRSTGDNLLECDILQEPMSRVKGNRFVLKGKLIYGDD